MRALACGLLIVSLFNAWGISQPITIVAIDAGHGGDDTGGIGIDDLYEKEIVLKIAHLIALEAVHFPRIKVILTRSDDRSLSPAERLAAAQGAHLAISLHLDFSYDPRARGITALVPTNAQSSSRALAEALRLRLIASTRTLDRGTHQAPLWLRRLPIPAVQLNLGFLTNPEEARKLAQLAYQRRVAQAILEGINDFLRSN
jgi:N-acetylmuramoyl-L-alanine amidase